MIALFEQRINKPIRVQKKKEEGDNNLGKYLLEIYHENKEQVKEEPSKEEEMEEDESIEEEKPIEEEQPIEAEKPIEGEKEIREKMEKAGIPIFGNKFVAPNYKAEYAEEEEEIKEELISIRYFPAYEAAALGINAILKKTMKIIEEKEGVVEDDDEIEEEDDDDEEMEDDDDFDEEEYEKRRKRIERNKKNLDYNNSFNINFTK